jgi:glycosyltransferase involved in cell wall biosynthesis
MNSKPTFAFVTIGNGSYLGSTVRDITLANALHRRGFKVAVYWMLECNPDLVADGIRQRMLCRATRYRFRRPSEFLDRIIGSLLYLIPLRLRVRLAQNFPGFIDRLLVNLIRSLYETPNPDRFLVKRLLKYLALDEVDHLMMSFGSIGPLALAAKKNGTHPFDYLLTFQGDEDFAKYARRAGLFAEYRERLNEVTQGSPWPAIVISQDYRNRIVDEMALDPERLQVIYNGVDLPESTEKPPLSILKTEFPNLLKGISIVSYIGRQEVEKGIDLLLYAAKLLDVRRIPMQLVICGATAKGRAYKKIIAELADYLGIVVHHAGTVSPEVRNALYAHSRCVVYPSVYREPFGLVAVEAMSHGTPVLVPDYGGITEVIRYGEKAGGLTFKTWNSADLAQQIERLLTDEMLHRKLTENTRAIAARFSAEQMADAVLAHIGVDTHECSDDDVLPERSRKPRAIEGAHHIPG